MIHLIMLFGAFLLCSTICGAAPNLNILNGQDADIREFPYMVGINIKSVGYSICGGSILNRNTILTAAHCFTSAKAEDLEVWFGNENIFSANRTKVSKIYIHEDWESGHACARDIGVLKIDPPLVFSDSVQPIKLPQLNEPIPENKIATITGWGTDENNQIQTILQKVNVRIVKGDDCKNIWQAVFPLCRVNERYEFCAQPDISDGKRRGGCTGDDGGPLVINGIQYGIISHNYGACGNPNVPPLYTKVSGLIDWLANKM